MCERHLTDTLRYPRKDLCLFERTSFATRQMELGMERGAGEQGLGETSSSKRLINATVKLTQVNRWHLCGYILIQIGYAQREERRSAGAMQKLRRKEQPNRPSKVISHIHIHILNCVIQLQSLTGDGLLQKKNCLLSHSTTGQGKASYLP